MEPVPPEAKAILYYYGAALFLAVLFIIRRTRGPKGMTLKLGGHTRKAGDALGGSTAHPPAPQMIPPERILNVVFNWNGHSWDAYEVLGAPAGSSLASVEVIFGQALREQSVDTHPFLRAAFEAVKNSHRR